MSYNINSIPNIAPVGTVMQYTGTSEPNGWVICDGQSRSNASGQYNNLSKQVTYPNWSNYNISTALTSGLWVIGGRGGGNLFATSTDGITWTGRGYGSGYGSMFDFVTGIAYGNGIWVAAGGHNGGAAGYVTATSTDGITWTGRETETLFNFSAAKIAYGNGIFTCTGAANNALAISTNGINFTPKGLMGWPSDGGCCLYANGIWVAGGGGGGSPPIVTSTNNWSNYLSRASGIFGFCRTLAFGNGTWIAGGNGTNTLAYSTDNAANWTGLGASVFSSYVFDAVYGNGIFVAVGSGGNAYATSVDGIYWIGRGTTISTSFNNVNFNGSIFVFSKGPPNTIYTSTDGINLTPRNSQGDIFTTNAGPSLYISSTLPNISSQAWSSVSISSNGQVMAACSSTTAGGFLFLSTNTGKTWTASTSLSPPQLNFSSVAVSATGQYALTSVTGGNLYVSSNASDSAATWSTISNSRNWTDVAVSSNGQIMVAVGTAIKPYLSTNSGSAWSSYGTEQNYTAVAMSSTGQYMAATVSNGNVYVSTNTGTTWTNSGLLTAQALTVTNTTGNPVQTTYGNYTILSFNSSGTLTIPAGQNLTVGYIVVGGGGSGGGTENYGGGGGGGGIVYNLYGSKTFTAGTQYTITVGSGGASVTSGAGNAGTASSITSGPIGSYTFQVSAGGGSGGTISGNGAAGGTNIVTSGDTGVIGGVGAKYGGSLDGTGGAVITDPNAGLLYSVGGGGAGANGVGINGGGNGGYTGNANNPARVGVAGTTNSGGGGGGGCNQSTPSGQSGAGGSGVVIIYYTTNQTIGANFNSIAMSSNGQSIIASTNGPANLQSLYTTSNLGLTWRLLNNTSGLTFNGNWSSVSMSSDGMSIIASTNSGYIYTSINGGTTWSLATSIADTPRTWQTVALSGDGTKAIATTNPGQVYTSTDGQIFTPYNLANTTTTDGTTLKYIMKC